MDNITKCAQEILKDIFGYDSFRPLQLEIIKNLLAGKDTLAIMPTGGGKSLCYQIPALIFKGITIVVSPLISLMQDQVSSLKENGVPAEFLNSSLEFSEYLETVKKLKDGEIKIVYVSPEGLASDKMMGIFHECSMPINCITIDEAHCVSEWGHDFRPDYLSISNVRKHFPNAVCLALTATATASVQQDIIKNLQLYRPTVFTASFNRKNIFLEVKPKKNALSQVIECIEKHKDESGIIYCFSRKSVDELTMKLHNEGYSVLNYHAGLSDIQRTKNQNLFIKDKVRIIVATVAFGMGINKPNVRFVIHYDMAKSLEEYYQEIGRAGRDGLESHALLLYSPGDIHKIRFFFNEAADPEKSERLLQGMINYAKARTCRRRALLSYFGEFFSGADTSADECCDICAAGPVNLTDVTIPSQKLMSCIFRLKQHYGAAYVIDVLLGSKQKRIIENHHNELSTWGIGKELEKSDWFELTDLLIETGYILKVGEYNVLAVSKMGALALTNRTQIKLPVQLNFKNIINAPKQKPSFVLHKKNEFLKNLSEKDTELYNAIKQWRNSTAEKENIAPYMIFGDKTIEELVEKKPASEKELLSVFGIGTVKAEKIGAPVLRIIGNHI
ncbi:MAG: DNA helicase RecQ [Treponema sp.]|nr:MAG: DNA helicase RecQ [Treponema sp.]